MRGKEDPYSKIAETNNREQKGASNYVWALKDINFSVEQGEVLGVIGKNGAGKSTLLKLLSRVTAPTTGSIKARGRIASLLEVGTGFHPELSGRDNIYLNGAIMGMRRAEIKAKFDEIVDFAGVERYIDTPVKRYSSGMYVRLAFAVAAHLEPEILIVDEVLAVGDAQFQKKAIGKMKDVSQGQGRTVLFVSHNMKSILSLCKNTLLIKQGTVDSISDSATQVKKYLNIENNRTEYAMTQNNIEEIGVVTANIKSGTTVLIEDKCEIFIKVHSKKEKTPIRVSLSIRSENGFLLFQSISEMIYISKNENCEAVFSIPSNLLNENLYVVGASIISPTGEVYYIKHDLFEFSAKSAKASGVGELKRHGLIKPSISNDIRIFNA